MGGKPRSVHVDQIRRWKAETSPKRARAAGFGLGFPPIPFGYSLRGHCRTERRKDRWFGNPKGIVSSSPAAESARLPWVSVRAILNGVVAPLRHRATIVGVGRQHPLGFGAESLWDSALLIPQGIGSNPSGIGQECPRSHAASDFRLQSLDATICRHAADSSPSPLGRGPG